MESTSRKRIVVSSQNIVEVKVTEECIARGKSSKNPLTRKRANFASVVRKWKHEKGGILKALDYANYITKKPAY